MVRVMVFFLNNFNKYCVFLKYHSNQKFFFTDRVYFVSFFNTTYSLHHTFLLTIKLNHKMYRMQGGELFSFIQERAESAFTERGLLFKKTCFISILQNKYLNLLFSIKHLS